VSRLHWISQGGEKNLPQIDVRGLDMSAHVFYLVHNEVRTHVLGGWRFMGSLIVAASVLAGALYLLWQWWSGELVDEA
jgi:hypothetical protein